MSVAACLICRDGAATVSRAIGSVREHVSEVNVFLAGQSRDDTPAILERLAAQRGAPIVVQQGEWRDDFAWAREQSFAMASPACSWLMWLDSDEELVGGENLRGILAELALSRDVDVDCLHLRFTADVGDRTIGLWRDAIVRRGTARWKERVHEYLVLDRPDAFRRVDPGLVRLVDRGENRARRPPDRYLRLVELGVAEGSTRALWYLGTIRAAQGDPARAAAAFEEFIARPDAPASLRKQAADVLPEARQLAARKAGRNAPCPCGSGVKVKKCGCLDRAAAA